MNDATPPTRDAARRALLKSLLERWRDLKQQGRLVSAAEVCADHPDLAAELESLARFPDSTDRSPLDPETAPATDSLATLPGEDLAPAGQADPGRRYEFQAALGKGGMGVVYRVLDRSLARVVALKVIRADVLTPALRARFTEEARAVARLSHPHIVQVFDFGETRPPDEAAAVPFFTLEYVERGSLSDALVKDQPLTPDLAAQVVARVARGMQHAHDRGIVHRDLKPENVLLAEPGDVAALNTPLGCPKVTDFGLARLVQSDQRLTQAGVRMGTPSYMAPEQADGLPDVGPPADVFSLGVILYRLLTGKVPFSSTSLTQLMYQICHETPVPPRAVRPEVPEGLESLCLWCLEKDVPERPTMHEVASGLERWLEGLARPEPSAPAGVEATKTSPRTRMELKWRVGGCAGAVTVALGIMLLITGVPKKTEDFRPADPTPPPLKIRPIRVTHYATAGKEEEPRGRIGERSLATWVGDAVTLTVELSEPGYCFVIAFNFDGKEEVLWPVDDKGEPSKSLPPPRQQTIRYPGNNLRLPLDDNEKGGLQAYAVVASPRPLSGFGGWRRTRPAGVWKVLPPGKAVWEADVNGAYQMNGGLSPDRGKPREALGTPPLAALCQSLSGGEDGVVVEAVAFPVLPREGK